MTSALRCALAALLLGCAPGASTAVHLTVGYDSAWQLDGLEVQVDDRDVQAPIGPEVRLLVPEGWAGRPHAIDVWGLRAGERRAHGQTVATPVAGRTVEAMLTLSLIPTEPCPRCLDAGTPAPADGGDERPDGGEGRPDAGTTAPPDAGTTAPPDAGTTAPPDGGGSEPGCDGIWRTETIAPALAYFTSLALDGQGGIHLAHATPDGTLGLAERAPGGDWRLDSLPVEAWRASLAVDPDGGLHLSYYARPTLRYAGRPPGGGWSLEDIDLGWDDATGTQSDVGAGNSLVLDGAGGVHVTYVDDSAGNLKYADRSPAGEWTVGAVADDPSAPLWASANTSLAIDAGGGLHATYLGDRYLAYAYRPPAGTWTGLGHIGSKYDVRPHLGPDNGLAIDRAGGLRISYTNAFVYGFNPALWVAHLPAGGGWAIGEVDAPADGAAGPGNAIAVAPSGDVYVSYEGVTTGSVLKVAHQSPAGPWAITTVASAGEGGLGTSIAVDTAGRVYVSHLGESDLKLATLCPAP